MVERRLKSALLDRASTFSVVTLTGPRQSGKTTLCRMAFPERRRIALESPDAREFATSDPRGFLATLPDGGVLDEVQRCPDLLSYLQEDVDERPQPGRWILNGSNNLLPFTGLTPRKSRFYARKLPDCNGRSRAGLGSWPRRWRT